MSRVIHTGQALVDATAQVRALPARGQNSMADGWSQEAGGAVNILAAAARSGATCVHAGAIGTGPNGDLVREALRDKRPPDPVREWFEWDRAASQGAALWDLLAQVNANKGRAPTYPTPLDATRKRTRELRPVDPAAFEALQSAASTTQ